MSARYPLVRNSSAFATRPGVRCNPSLPGSSPSNGSISATRSSIERSRRCGATTNVLIAFALVAFIHFKDVPLRLGDANFFQLRPSTWKHARPSLFQAIVDQQPEILRRRHETIERFDLFVQILMI